MMGRSETMAAISLTEQDVAQDVVILNLQNVAFSDEQCMELCADNRDFRFELTARKELVIMTLPPPGTGRRNGRIYYCLEEWAQKMGRVPRFLQAYCFQSRTGLRLVHGTASWS